MGQYKFEMLVNGGHGCDRKAMPGDKLYARCMKLDCPECLIYDFLQMLKTKRNNVLKASFTHWPGTEHEVVDDFVTNTRKSGNL